MIKINLIPVKRKKKAKPVPLFLAVMLLLIVASVIGVYAYSASVNAQIETLENKKKANAEKIKELDKKVAEVKNFESLNAQVQKHKEIIEQLTKNQRLPVRLLDEISGRITDGVWLKTMRISGGKLNISGAGFKNTDIVSFVQNLKESEMFTDVNLLGTSRALVEGVETYSFNMNIEVVP
jgi:type IV pilus assembly protein PilN